MVGMYASSDHSTPALTPEGVFQEIQETVANGKSDDRVKNCLNIYDIMYSDVNIEDYAIQQNIWFSSGLYVNVVVL